MRRVSAAVVLLLASLPASAEIRRIDIIHLSHQDVGFTDHPAVTREMQVLYLDQAIDACLRFKTFAWTAESLLGVSDWWQQATSERRRVFLDLVRTGRIATGALPLNNTPFLDREQWRQMLHWLPEDLWRSLHPTVAVQDDVNGFPRAGAAELLNRGVTRLFMGLNSDSGGPPVPRPTAFWWKQPDGRRLFVFLGDSYPAGYSYFHAKDWRRGPVPRVADTTFRPPRAGDFFLTDEASLREAHRLCLARLARLEKQGYRHSTLVIPFSNQWRMDNDPPFPPIAAFVDAWNRLGLQPALRLATAATALADLESEAGRDIPEYTGEWPDWWANGTASAPREVAASRAAKRWLAALASPVFAKVPPRPAGLAEELRKELCLFDEHTWGSSMSVAQPDTLETVGQFNEKARLALRPMALAEWLAAQTARTLLADAAPGLWAVNTAPLPYTGWIPVPTAALRREHPGADHTAPGMQPWAFPKSPADLSPENDPAVFSDTVPNQVTKFWVENLPAHAATIVQPAGPVSTAPAVQLDAHGWPASVTWPGAKAPLFGRGIGDFTAIRPTGFAPRSSLNAMAAGKPGAIESTTAAPLAATVEQTGHSIIYTQSFTHPSLIRGKRLLEIWRSEPRATLTVTLNRRSSDLPESFYLAFPLPVGETNPILSEGGIPFAPYRDQLPGSCMDYFAIDGWVHYATTAGDWLWVSHDAPLVTFGQPEVWARRRTAPATANLLALVFTNFWYTNFVGNQHGVMEFTFDLLWRPRISGPDALSRTIVSRPIVVQH